MMDLHTEIGLYFDGFPDSQTPLAPDELSDPSPSANAPWDPIHGSQEPLLRLGGPVSYPSGPSRQMEAAGADHDVI